MNTVTRYREPIYTHGSLPDFFRSPLNGIDTRSRSWIHEEISDRPQSTMEEVSIDTPPLVGFQIGGIGPARKAILEDIGKCSFRLASSFDVLAPGTKRVATVEMGPADAPGSPLTSGVIVRRVTSLYAVVVDALVKAWDTGSAYPTIHPLKVPPRESTFCNEPDLASGWLCWGQSFSKVPESAIKELSCTGVGVTSEGELYTLDKVASRKRNLAREILNRALERYHRPDGYEGSLVEAVWEVEQIGPEAWPALWDLVVDGGPECEYFLGAAVRLEGVEPQARRKALLTAARNPNPDVRSRLLELLEEIPDELRAEVLRELTADGRPDDGVTERAREVWHAQAV